MISSTTIFALTELIRFGVENLEAGQRGEKTDEEIMEERDQMVKNVMQASDRWRNRGA